MGIFLTLEEDAASEKWCRAQGFYQMPGSPRKYPGFQVYSAAQYFAGGKPDLPTMPHPVTGREMHQSDMLDRGKNPAAGATMGACATTKTSSA